MSAERRVLVTGARGFLGPWVVAELALGDWDVATMSGRDVTAERVAALAPDVVIHLAAMTHPDECEREPQRARQANVELTRELARGARPSCERFVYASTDLVFEGDRGRYNENDQPRPVCVYGATKLQGERAAMEELGERATTARLALLYGSRLERAARPTFAETMVERAGRGEAVRLYLDQFRTPLYVEDAAESLARIAALPAAESIPVIHLGGPERCSRHEMGVTAFDVFDLPPELAHAVPMAEHETLAPRPADVSLVSARARAMRLPACGLREGFQRFRDRMKGP